MTYRAGNRGRALRLALSFAAFALLSVAPIGEASAFALKTLHSFCAQTNCADGEQSIVGLLMDQSGDLFSASLNAGKFTIGGTAFKLTLNAQKTGWKFHDIHFFCGDLHCVDGGFSSELISDVDGNLYGVTCCGSGFGVIYKLKPVAHGWHYSKFFGLCQQTCIDGGGEPTRLTYAGQSAGASWDKTSPLFGVTNMGGTYGNGVVYELAYENSQWAISVIHNFNSGYAPGELFMDRSGNLFGITRYGGKYAGGLMYKLAAGTWQETVLHNFCNTANCADGQLPRGRLTMDAAGNLFGVTENGGTSSQCVGDRGCGVVFERGAGGQYSVLYNFCSSYLCGDGEYPRAGLLLDSSGSLYGTTVAGGGNLTNNGTLFKLTNNGGIWSESVLYSFCAKTDCADGAQPQAPVSMDASGNIFGTTYAGGTHLDNSGATAGTVFEWKP